MRSLLLFTFFIIFVMSCGKAVHNWDFEIKNGCRFPDELHLETNYSPVRVKVVISGYLSEPATVYFAIYQKGSNESGGDHIKLPKGKVNYVGNYDMYEQSLSLIYVPDLIGKTEGKLNVKIKIY